MRSPRIGHSIACAAFCRLSLFEGGGDAILISWILDSGGAGRGAWQGGVIYEFIEWSRANNAYPLITMGASAGGYAAADVATGTGRTVMKGWTRWGKETLQEIPYAGQGFWSSRKFRQHLRASIQYVMEEAELSEVFNSTLGRKLLVFTTRVRRRNSKPFRKLDLLRIFLKSATRKLPKALKYLPHAYIEEPVIFATNLPEEMRTEFVRPLTRVNYHRVIEASCIVPLAMGQAIHPNDLLSSKRSRSEPEFAADRYAVFVDGGYALKMPMGIFAEDARFHSVASWAAAEKTIIFCCDPKGGLWENSSRLRRLNTHPKVVQAMQDNRLLVVYPDHKVEAGFLCLDNDIIMRTFQRGRDQGRRLLNSEAVRRFFEIQ
jgi:hypothetical protein